MGHLISWDLRQRNRDFKKKMDGRMMAGWIGLGDQMLQSCVGRVFPCLPLMARRAGRSYFMHDSDDAKSRVDDLGGR